MCILSHGGTVDQLFTLAGLLEGSWEFANPVYMCFVDLGNVYDHVLRGILWGVLREYGVLLQDIRSLHHQSESCVRILGKMSNTCPVRVGLHQGGPLSPILFVIFMDRISRNSRGRKTSDLESSELCL